MTPVQRATVIASAVRLGLNNIRASLSSTPPPWADAFIGTPSNWNAVILGGAIVAALAIAGEPTTPTWVGGELLPDAVAGISPSLSDLGRESGANREGPNYHVSAATHTTINALSMLGSHASFTWWVKQLSHVYYCAALSLQLALLSVCNVCCASGCSAFRPIEGAHAPLHPQGYLVRSGLAPAASSMITATGDDGGLLTDGAAHAAAFVLYTMAPTHPVAEFHYWGDTHAIPECVSQYLALARHYNDSAMAYGFRELLLRTADDPQTTETTAMNAPVAVLYFTPAGTASELATLPLARAFPETHSATSRSSWFDANATFIGWKGSNVSVCALNDALRLTSCHGSEASSKIAAWPAQPSFHARSFIATFLPFACFHCSGRGRTITLTADPSCTRPKGSGSRRNSATMPTPRQITLAQGDSSCIVQTHPAITRLVLC